MFVIFAAMKDYFSSSFILGILGGGQLGKMLLQETSQMDIRTAVLDPSSFSPCKGRCEIFEIGDLKDFDTVYQFGKLVDVLTFEIEHVNVDALEKLEKEGKRVYPKPSTLRIIQNKQFQKRFYAQNGIPTSPFVEYGGMQELLAADIQFPCVWKSALHGYDGKGVKVLRNENDLEDLPDDPCIIEGFVEGMREISIMVARRPSGEVSCYPAVEMEFHPTANLVEFLFCPSTLTESQVAEANEIALRVAEGLDLVGIMAVEMFVTAEGKILVNESAPRPHNSGHHTIESNYSSQYLQHLRAILDLPLGSTRQHSAAVMLNLLGEPNHVGYVCYEGVEESLAQEGVYVHIYGKKQTRPFRKMGHVTIISEDLENAIDKARIVRDKLKSVSCENRR